MLERSLRKVSSWVRPSSMQSQISWAKIANSGPAAAMPPEVILMLTPKTRR